MVKAKSPPKPGTRKGAEAKPKRKPVSLTEQAILQVELMLIGVYRIENKPLPEEARLRRLAKRYYRKHFE
ncbi:MAG: hypothetical protein KA066_01060 [Candidatus Pacebacteria bacterium]|nr:hypothetical protein [Candidatus Paceibacterota bacterium]